MTFFSRMRGRSAAWAVAMTLVVVVTAVAMGLGYTEPVSSGALGPEWQCTRLAFVFTSCTRVVRLKTAGFEDGKALACSRPSAWRGVFGFRR